MARNRLQKQKAGFQLEFPFHKHLKASRPKTVVVKPKKSRARKPPLAVQEHARLMAYWRKEYASALDWKVLSRLAEVNARLQARSRLRAADYRSLYAEYLVLLERKSELRI